MGGMASAAFPRSPLPKIAHMEYHRPERDLKGSQLQVCPLRALKKATEVMLQHSSSYKRGLK